MILTNTILVVGFIACIIALACVWAYGIHDMHEKHPDYKGEDFL